MRKVSLALIAEEAGVSKTTASFVLNGQGLQKRISAKVIERVEQVARKYNYKPNRLARSLRTGATNFLGLIVVDIASYYYSRLSRAIENSAANRGYRVMVCSSDEKDSLFNEWVDELLENKVEGLIITPTMHAKDKIIELQKANYPFVLIDRYFPEIETDFVGIDNFAASFQATKAMLDKGYRRIGVVSFSPSLEIFGLRIKGYIQALQTYQVSPDDALIRVVEYDNIQQQAQNHIIDMLQMGVDALLFFSARIGLAGLKCLQEQGVKIPEDVAVFSFDDNELFSLMTPGISAIAQPLEDIGSKAVDLLLSRLYNSQKPIERITLPSRLVVRNSM